MRLVIVGMLMLAFLAPMQAQDLKADEAAIRALIARQNDAGARVPVMPGYVFWSGALKAPVTGGEKPIEIGGPNALSNRVPGSQKSTQVVNKLEISKAGDMAWEFSTGRTSYELKSGTKNEFTVSLLRVWRKDAGQWKVAAQFVRPHEE